MQAKLQTYSNVTFSPDPAPSLDTTFQIIFQYWSTFFTVLVPLKRKLSRVYNASRVALFADPFFSPHFPVVLATLIPPHHLFTVTMDLSNLLQGYWSNVVSTYSPTQIILVGNLLVQTLAFWIPALFYLSIDLIPSHPLKKYKIQPAKHPTSAEVWHCIQTVLVNQYLISTPLDIALALLAQRAGHLPALTVLSTLPTLREIGRDFLISLITREILFYYSHRLGHIPALYKRIHKKHHQFTAPISPSAEYAHPVEHLVANVIPVIAGLSLYDKLISGPFILHSHVVTFWIFLTFELIETTTVHSGYAFLPGISRYIRFHDWHHEYFNGCFGAMGWIDWIHGTDQGFKRTYSKPIEPRKRRRSRGWRDID